MSSGYHILGTTVGEGFDFSLIPQAAGNILSNVTKGVMDKKQADADTADANAKLAAANAADVQAASAAAAFLLSTVLATAAKTPDDKAKYATQLEADQAALDAASAAQDEAAAQLPASMIPARIKAIQAALAKATTDFQAAARGSDDILKKTTQAKVTAWQKTLAKATNTQIVKAGITPSPQQFAPHGGVSFLSRKVGPLPVWGWGALVAVLGAGTVAAVKLLR